MMANELMPFLASLWSPPWANSAAEIAAVPVRVTEPDTNVVSGTADVPLSDVLVGFAASVVL